MLGQNLILRDLEQSGNLPAEVNHVSTKRLDSSLVDIHIHGTRSEMKEAAGAV